MKQTSLKNVSKDARSYNNRRRFSANGFSLLPLVSRRLFVIIVLSAFINIFTVCHSVSTFAAASTLNVSIVNSISLDLAPSSINGTFASSSTTDNINISTDHYTGYTLGIRAKTANSNALINQQDNARTLPSITTNVSEVNYQNDAYKDTYNNTWGYKPSKYYDATNDITVANADSLYFPAPTSITDQTVLAKTTTANIFNSQTNQRESDGYNIAIGARVNPDTAAGTYENVFVITVVANAIPYTITFNGNSGGDSVTNMPTSLNDSTYNETITLPDTVPFRVGYDFVGWCGTATTTVTTQTATMDVCSGPTYNPNGDGTNLTYTLNQTTINTGINLYAMWETNLLYGEVASKVKLDSNNGPRTQTTAELQATITVPTSNDPATDTSNSGIYLYDSATFGAASDESNDYDIYYYRGILDNNLDGTLSTYGSNGNSYYYPNYVKLGNTCWRIVRTTGSGGVKMIYNGLYSTGTNTNSCANTLSDASVTAIPFAVKGNSSQTNWYKNVNRVGYTFNNNPAIQDTTTLIDVNTVFGGNSDMSINNADSNIKSYLENTWFRGAISNYESILEPAAGYCNDRTLYSTASTAPTLVTNIAPYGSSSNQLYFGANERNRVNNGKLSLTCQRGSVDIYSTNNAETGNKQLSHPVSLLTADEAALAGSGYAASYGNTSTTSSNYHYNSYLRTGNDFWLLSPHGRYSDAASGAFRLYRNGYLTYDYVTGGYEIRPVISLNHQTMIVSGSGTAADPWIISVPQ